MDDGAAGSVEAAHPEVAVDDRLDAGASLTVPMWHKEEAATRSHYQTLSVRIPDAPRADEVVE